MSRQPKFAFKRDFLQMLSDRKGWPPHSMQAGLLRRWRSTGMKRETYTRLRSGGSGTRKDLSDLLRIHLERAYDPFCEVIDSYLQGLGTNHSPSSLSALFEVTTNPVETVDYMESGGAFLFELLPRVWSDPMSSVMGFSGIQDATRFAEWLRTVVGRETAGHEPLTSGQAQKVFSDVWGYPRLCLERDFAAWSNAIPWATVYSGFVAPDDPEKFVATGGNIVLPLHESCYRSIASGQRRFDDISESDLKLPCYGVYFYASCESPETNCDEPTKNSLISLMWQIAALSEDGPVRALAPSPIPTSETRLRKAGFRQIGVCEVATRKVLIWETEATKIQQFILNAMRFVLRSDGFMDFPPRR